MSEEALQAAIKGVQETLSKYVKRPPLSEKFLKKPPFRYLHDIVNAVRKYFYLLYVFCINFINNIGIRKTTGDSRNRLSTRRVHGGRIRFKQCKRQGIENRLFEQTH
jgi:hypothetical protein